jgi:hypothetical protein
VSETSIAPPAPEHKGNHALMDYADLDHAEELLANSVIDEKRLFIPNPKAATA